MESEGQPLGWGSAVASSSVASRRWALARFARLRGLWFVVVLVVASAFLAGLPWARSKAVVGDATTSSAAQVRVFENGEFRGSGTLVDRNWVLTVAHLFDRPDNPRYIFFRFGAVNNRNDQNDPTHLRSIDRIVLAPRGDMAMVRFADPVPEGTWIPSLANQAPRVFDWAHVYVWGPVGTVLNWASALVYDPVAIENAAFQRAVDPVFASVFAEGIGPIVLNLPTVPGDSGGGVFAPRGVLAGVHSCERGISSRQRLGKPFPALLLGFLCSSRCGSTGSGFWTSSTVLARRCQTRITTSCVGGGWTMARAVTCRCRRRRSQTSATRVRPRAAFPIRFGWRRP